MAAFNTQAAPQAPFRHPAPINAHGTPVGTFAPGTKVQVGKHRVLIEKYLSEGGFAHVYVVRMPQPVDGVDLAVLKRVAVPDKGHLANMRTEVETMKKLKGHRQIVRYIDSHASQLKGGGYEVFLLMEYCSGGGLIDFMNTRLRNRLTEPEILKIFSDVAEGVACMHYLLPPLLHRDLKIENVLISDSGSSEAYKLCDFGSAAPPRPAASSAAEGRLIEDDIQQHTTLQYRSPEMIDVYRKQPIDEKSDIWALGVFLYKLCYYKTPFEEVGQMAILNASFKYPAYPAFSDKLKMLIATMLREDPAKRPNIYQVMQQACSMQGKEVPVRDIYAGRSQSEKRKSQQMPTSCETVSAAAGATLAPPSDKKPTAIPDIAPMRRGRPTRPVSHHGSVQPSPSPLRMIDQVDPFTSLDGNRLSAADELSSRFPTLDQFSLLSERGKFDFEPAGTGYPELEKVELPDRSLDVPADEASAQPPLPEKPKPTKTAPPATNSSSWNVLDGKDSFEAKDIPQRQDNVISAPLRPSMVSTGTMTSPSPPASFTERPVYRFPPKTHIRRPSSLPRSSQIDTPTPSVGGSGSGSRLSNLLSQDAARSQLAVPAEPKSPSSSRPSLEGTRTSPIEFDSSVSRSRSTNSKMRPASTSIVSKMEFYRERISKKSSTENSEKPSTEDLAPLTAVKSETNIASDVDFLRSKEEEEKSWKGHKRNGSGSGSGHKKRGSLPSISLSGTKNLLSGRFGEAFRKFEGGNNESGHRNPSLASSQDPINVLTPIAGSEATDLSDERHGFDETEDLSPEMRRELERQRLSAEEKRVASAAAEYRKGLAERDGERSRDPTRAVSIQNKVHSLLKENDGPVTRSPAGRGRFTNSNASSQMKQFGAPSHLPNKPTSRVATMPNQAAYPPKWAEELVLDPPPIAGTSANVRSSRTTPRPAAPPKPAKMRTGAVVATQSPVDAGLANRNLATGPTDDWETNFSKRYPSLSGLEMVETQIDRPKVTTVRTKEV